MGETSTPATGLKIAGEFTLLSAFEEGMIGRVWKAETNKGELVAVKILKPQHIQYNEICNRFLQEGGVLNRMRHPNIVHVYKVGKLPDGCPYMVMELLNGLTLEEHIRRQARLGVGEAQELLLQIVAGLVAAHNAGVIHRDVKPENIFLLDNLGRLSVKLIDFGIAKVEDGLWAEATRTGTVMGTPLYMAPEQAAGRSADPRMDVYSVGAVAYHMLMGQTPFLGTNISDVLPQLMRDRPQPLNRAGEPPLVPHEVEATILKALEKDPKKRQPTMADLFAEMAKWSTRWIRPKEPGISATRTFVPVQSGDTMVASAPAPHQPTPASRKARDSGGMRYVEAPKDTESSIAVERTDPHPKIRSEPPKIEMPRSTTERILILLAALVVLIAILEIVRPHLFRDMGHWVRGLNEGDPSALISDEDSPSLPPPNIPAVAPATTAATKDAKNKVPKPPRRKEK